MVPHPPLRCRGWRFVQDSSIGGGHGNEEGRGELVRNNAFINSTIFSSTSQNSMTKKTTKGDRHAMLKVIQHGVTIAKY
jgi:hypothetical protein